MVLGCVAGVLGTCGGNQMVTDVSVAGYWRLGARVVGRRMCADPVKLPAIESILLSWLSGVEQRSGEAVGECVLDSLPRSGMVIRRGCRRVSPSGQPIIRKGADKSGVAAGE